MPQAAIDVSNDLFGPNLASCCAPQIGLGRRRHSETFQPLLGDCLIHIL